MRILIAPDKFKHTLTARQAAEAMRAGALDALPQAEIELCPVADGGDGTGPVLAEALHAEARELSVLDPLQRTHRATWWFEPAAKIAIIEMAEAAGLRLLRKEDRQPLKTTSFGVGQLILAATAAGAREILLGVGGSATVDGAAGTLQAIGFELLNARDEVLREPIGGGELARVAAVKSSAKRIPPIRILCDVDNPSIGPNGAPAVFGPQKGASPADIRTLEAGLAQWLDVLQSAFGERLHEQPGGGAAGGLAAGLAAARLGKIVNGFDAIANIIGLKDKLARCNLCLTGEGKLDWQTTRGKAVSGAARLAKSVGRDITAIVGTAEAGKEGDLAALRLQIGLRDIVVCTPTGQGWPEARANAAINLRAATREYLLAYR